MSLMKLQYITRLSKHILQRSVSLRLAHILRDIFSKNISVIAVKNVVKGRHHAEMCLKGKPVNHNELITLLGQKQIIKNLSEWVIK